MAETAMEQTLTHYQAWGFGTPPTTTYDSTRLSFAPEGYVDVVWQRLRPQAMLVSAVYVIRARGVYTRDDWGGSADATRVVTRYAEWGTPSLNVKSAWTALGGLTKSGGSGVLSGTDACGISPTVAGVAVPTAPGYSQSGGSSVPTGTPPILQLAPNPAAAADSIHMDWPSIFGGTAFPFDVVIPPGSWPSFADPNYWPVIYIDNPGTEYTIPSDGRGILIVRGSAKIAGSIDWDGLVMVGNKLTSSGSNTVEGAVITGLNLQLGEAVTASDVGSGTKFYRYNSCKLWSAFQGHSRLHVLGNTWFDGWALY
jgi:hypothetical protein